MSSSVRIRVPATTANVGPGFDCLGIALKIFNTVTVAKGSRKGADVMADEAASAFFRATGKKSFHFRWSITGDVPRARGLGSSVTVRLGLLHGLNHLTDSPLNRRQLFELCAELEGHPDNAAPAAFGGFTIARADGVQRFPVPSSLSFVLLIPDFEIATPDARRVLPKAVSLKDAAHSAANAAAIAAAFASGKFNSLNGAFEDFLHQPKRTVLIPFLPDVIKAGCKAGALGGWLSGSGSTIACMTKNKAAHIASAMQKACPHEGMKTIIARADNSGVRKI